VKTSENGVYYYDSATSHDLSTTPRVVLFKVIATNFSVLNNEGSTGGKLDIGSGNQSAYYQWYFVGGDTYPVKGGWLFVPIDPNVTAYRDNTVGSPNLAAVDYYGLACTFSATAKSQNVAMDAIDWFNSGKGLTLTGGDGASADGTFEDFVTKDEGTAANRWAIVSTRDGVLYVLGTLTIGSSTATVFTDSNAVVVFPDSLTDDGFAGIAVDLSNASNDVEFNDCVFSGRGKYRIRHWFDTISDVDAGNDELDITAHGFTTGEAVLYAKDGGSDAIGLTDATEYWVEVVTADAISLHTSRQNAMTSATPVNLSAGSTGENHSITRQPVTLPELNQTGTTGVGFDANGCSFLAFSEINLTSKATLDGCKVVGTFLVDLNGATLSDGSLSGGTQIEGEHLVTTDDLGDISGCVFTSGGKGHAVEIDTAGSYTYADNTHTGYGPDRAQFLTDNTGIDASGEVITTLAAHGFSDGDPVYYNDEGGSASIGLTDGDLYYVNSITSTTLSLHRTRTAATSDLRRVDLSTSGAETHSLYSGNAAIVNSSGGSVTITVSGGDTPTIRNTPGSTTTVNSDVTITLTGLKDNTEIRVYNQSGTELAGVENATTGTPDNRSWSFAQPASTVVDIRILHGDTAAADGLHYENTEIEDYTIPGSNTSIPIQQRVDRNYSNPA
jgi:hypothetical protein